MSSSSAKYVSLTVAQCEKLREYQKKHNCTQRFLAAWAKKEFNLPKEPTQPAISKILKRQSQNRSQDNERKRDRSPKYPRLEELLQIWMAQCENMGYLINWDMVKTKAKTWAVPLKIADFSYSNGWIDGFRRRSGFRMHHLHGEASSSDFVAATASLESIRYKISQFAPKDVYNMDETALYYRSAPETTISKANVAGMKKDKSRITLALTVNADGSDLRDLLFIGKTRSPRCFGRGKVRAYEL
jgi:hypothetical protein